MESEGEGKTTILTPARLVVLLYLCSCVVPALARTVQTFSHRTGKIPGQLSLEYQPHI